ncbi:cation diffusion facilitator family transporter [Nesterenkonia alkaliphila]|nr:cation diffusion facilitator family transporter [Nesterenkonia alkaliphila]
MKASFIVNQLNGGQVMGAGHSHEHGLSPEEAARSPDFRRKLGIAFALVFAIVLAQGLGAWLSGSLAILVDMVHSLVDSSGLLIALIAASLMLRPPSKKRTWGFRRVESLAALAQGLLLVGISVYGIWEGVKRWGNPPEVAASEMLIFAAIGLALNIAAMLVLSSSRGANLNMRAAFLEVLMDALGTIAVVVSGILMLTTGYTRADTIAAFFIALLIIPRAAMLLRDTVRILMEFTPTGLDLDEVRKSIVSVQHVKEVHDLHASTVASGLPTLSAHVVLDESCFSDGHAADILHEVRRCLSEDFDVPVHHTTIQLETEGHRAAESASHP